MEINNLWWQDAIISIYSRVYAIVSSKLKTKYPNLVITDDDDKIDKPSFPTVYIHALQPDERGQDIEGSTINAISLTFQVEVYAKDRITANEVSGIVLEAFKTMRFTGTLPEFQNTVPGIKRTVARYRRIVGSGDKI